MSVLVVDCSVTMAWCFEDEASSYADAVLDAVVDGGAAAPSVWTLEVVNVLLVAERRRRLPAADSARFLGLLASLPIAVEELGPGRAFGTLLGVARESGLSSYDSAYLELAMRTGLPLATRDRALRTSCRKVGADLFAE